METKSEPMFSFKAITMKASIFKQLDVATPYKGEEIIGYVNVDRIKFWVVNKGGKVVKITDSDVRWYFIQASNTNKVRESNEYAESRLKNYPQIFTA